ncbi:MAG: tannase/feruloyl esterase family alpha/beta hydrolase [Rhodospirillaceae bacterium]|nr:tannase/feruloyl esterase family alpha/beta hydrolase [Rhodospirillaceae bacterium]
MIRHVFAIAAMGLATAIQPARGQDSAACAALASSANAYAFLQIVDAPTTVLSAKIVPAGGNGSIVEADLPEICRVEGQIAPYIGFNLRLPTKSWNGKFMMGGCGGPCGTFMDDRIDPALVRGYAVVVTDMGHKGPGFQFMLNNPQGQIDFGFRATHVTAVAAKELIAAFYGKRAERNYYWGCSTGGRQGMVSAQRFPEDFEGIIAGAPVWNQTGNNPFFNAWGAIQNLDKDGKPILDAAKLPLVHGAVMKACDAMDGLADGILQDPRRCAWDPKELQCQGRARSDCLTAAEADVVRKIYTGPIDARGHRLFFGMVRGSEDQWGSWIGADGRSGAAIAGPDGFASTTIGFAGYSLSGVTDFAPARDFDYQRDPARLGLKEYIFNAQNPDLRRYKNAGGKLIVYTGWHDASIPPEQAVDYYDTATRTMGGPTATTDFFRLFLLPAVNHCRYGFGGAEVDWITALENWVEKGQAPDQVIAHHMIEEPYPSVPRDVDGATSYTRAPRHPLKPGDFDRARPVYAYPDVAAYAGSGDPSKPESWRKAPR